MSVPRLLGVQLTAKQRLEVAELVRKGVTEGTGCNYTSSWKKWIGFLGSLEEGQKPGEYLENAVCAEDKAQWVQYFMVYLRKKMGLQGENRISAIVSAVRHQWNMRGHDITFMESSLVTAAKKGTRLENDQVAIEARRRKEEDKLPLTVEMVARAREMFWVNVPWTSEGMDRKVLWLAIALGTDMGLRPGHVTKRDGPKSEDHCIKAKEVTFLFGKDGLEGSVEGGEACREFMLQNPGEWRSKVWAVDIVILTSKRTDRGSFERTAKRITVDTDLEKLFILDLGEWFLFGGAKVNDDLVTRFAPTGGGRLTRKVLTKQTLNNGIKEVARMFGLPPHRFSGKSMRKGYASHGKQCSMDSDSLRDRAGWSENSTMIERKYAFSLDRGILGAAKDEEGNWLGEGVEGIRRMLPAGAVCANRVAKI